MWLVATMLASTVPDLGIIFCSAADTACEVKSDVLKTSKDFEVNMNWLVGRPVVATESS